MKRSSSRRSGFTLVEVMIASAIGVIVFAAVLSSFLTTQRMLKTAMAETELSLAMRELREKLLFHVSPTISGKVYSGLCGAVATAPDGRSTRRTFENQVRQGYVELYAPAANGDIDDTSLESMRIMGYTKGSSYFVVNEHTPDRDRHLGWLWPGRFSLATTRFADCVKFAAILPNDANNPMIYRLYFDLALKADVRNHDGSDIVRRERVAVPLLGRIQQMQDLNTDGKTTY